jgi:hypothetical protein
MSVGIGMGSLVHGSQDLYPTYLVKSKGFTDYQATVVAMIGACGAIMCVRLVHSHILYNVFICVHGHATVAARYRGVFHSLLVADSQ